MASSNLTLIAISDADSGNSARRFNSGLGPWEKPPEPAGVTSNVLNATFTVPSLLPLGAIVTRCQAQIVRGTDSTGGNICVSATSDGRCDGAQQ